uniref:uncharacterized protein LOC105350190 n=1 Tax=Fragaria vesca subsp. vesca TaxID=101020 RepID=UPI0005C8C9C4|nr:PREDICTED: uncharacterized protein LOC105350190 [Fragaria vesca subsp. vesca]
MSSICENIHNLLRHLNAPRKLSTFIAGFLRKIISKFHGVLNVFRQRKAMEQQEGSKIYPDTPALVVEQVKKDEYIFCQNCDKIGDHKTAMCPDKPERRLMYCTICRNIYPVFCSKPEEHGDKVEDYIFCRECRKIGDHESEMCPNIPKRRVLVCSVCSDLYPCKNQEEHGNKGVEEENWCSRCYRRGHRVQECPVKEYHPSITFFD